jgi:Protein of unknown function (DUF3618)
MISQSEQFEREAEETRCQLSGTLEELRYRMTPGRVLDEFLDYARYGAAGEFVRNIGREVRENPMPLVLIGIGIAWLMLASSRTSRAAIDRAAEMAARTANDIGAATTAAMARTSEWGQQTAARLSERAGNAAMVVSDRTADLAARARDAADTLTGKTWVTAASERTLGEADKGKAVLRDDGYPVDTAPQPR